MKTTNPKWRLCACNCGRAFPTKNKSKIYIDKQHADRDYNLTKRKDRLQKLAEERAEQEKKNSCGYYVNDEILRKYFDRSIFDEVECLFCTLENDGFRSEFVTRSIILANRTIHLFIDFSVSIRKGDYSGIVRIERSEKYRNAVSENIPRTTKKRITRSAEWHRTRLAKNQCSN